MPVSMKSLVGAVLNGGIDMKIVPTRLFVNLLAICVFCASTYAEAQTAAETAFGNFQESRQICKEIAVRLEGESELQREIIDVRDFAERDRLPIEKSKIDKRLLGRYQQQAAGQGVYLGNSFHGAPLSSYVAKSDGLYCGVGERHLKDAEKAGGDDTSWKLRRIYLDEIYRNTLLPWIECCSDISQETFLETVREAATIYRRGRARKNLQNWVSDMERKSQRDLQLTLKSFDQHKQTYSADYRSGITRDTNKFIIELKKLVR